MHIERVPRHRGARERLADFAPDVAVLDDDLGLRTGEVMTDSLPRREVPFALATPCGEGAIFPRRVSDVPAVSKHLDAMTIAAQIAQAQAGAP